MSFFDTEATVAAFELTFSARTTLTTNQVLNANAFTYRNLQKNSNSIIPLDNICVTYSKNGNVELWIKAPSTYFWLRAFINYSSSLPSFDWYGSDKVVDELNSPDIVQIIKPVLGGLEESNIYSLQEIKVGKWIDGKDIFRKVIKTTIPEYNAYSEYGGVNIVTVRYGVDTVIKQQAFIIGYPNDTNKDFNTYIAPNFTKKQYLTISTNTIQNKEDNNRFSMAVFNNYSGTDKKYAGATIYIIAEYTLV